jgi:HEAT repeat protein
MRTVLAAALAALLAGCGPSPPTLSGGKPVSYWVEELQAPDASRRKAAVEKLGRVGPDDPAVLPALLGALRDRDAGVRRAAVLALMEQGPGAREALPALDEMQRHDPDTQARRYAARAVAALQDVK